MTSCKLCPKETFGNSDFCSSQHGELTKKFKGLDFEEIKMLLSSSPREAFSKFLKPTHRVKLSLLTEEFKYFSGIDFTANEEFQTYLKMKVGYEITLESQIKAFIEDTDLRRISCPVCGADCRYSVQYNKVTECCSDKCKREFMKSETMRSRIRDGVNSRLETDGDEIRKKISQSISKVGHEELSARASHAASSMWAGLTPDEKESRMAKLQEQNRLKMVDDGFRLAKNERISDTCRRTWLNKTLLERSEIVGKRVRTMSSYPQSVLDDIRKRTTETQKLKWASKTPEEMSILSMKISTSLGAYHSANGLYPNQTVIKESIALLSDRSWLDNKYSTLFLNTEMIASELSVSPSLVQKWIHFHGIQMRYDHKVSSLEMKLVNELRSFGIEVVHSSRPKWLNGLELDIFLPEHNIAVEVNGNYWHSEDMKGVSYHLDKTISCEQNNVQLLHFFEHELNEHYDACVGMVISKCGLNSRVFARKCDIVNLSFSDASEFLEANHIQGKDTSSTHRYGLTCSGKLLAVMTFGKPRFDKDSQYELLRFCSLVGTNVVGGSSKLLSHFMKETKSISIVSYAHRKHSNGGLYHKIGFSLVRISEPGYFWSKGTDVLKRYQTQKQKLAALLGDKFNPNLSETENMKSNGYSKIYDCGQYVFKFQEDNTK